MVDTYVRPWWKTLAIYLLMVLVSTVIILTISLIVQSAVSVGGFQEAFYFIPEDARFDAPLWLMMGLIMSTLISPLWPVLLWHSFNLNKYDRESWKLKLLPVYPDDEFHVMFYAHKTDEGEEPKWVKPFRFNTTFTIVGSNTFPMGHGAKTYQVLESEKGYRYQMSQKEFNRIAPEMKDGKISGVFEWDTAWRWPSIVKIGD